MKLSSLTSIACQIKAVLDYSPSLKLSFAEVRQAARVGTMVEHLAHRFGNKADFSLLLSNENELTAVELAISDATRALNEGQIANDADSSNGFSLAMALVREAINQQFPMPSTSPFGPSAM